MVFFFSFKIRPRQLSLHVLWGLLTSSSSDKDKRGSYVDANPVCLISLWASLPAAASPPGGSVSKTDPSWWSARACLLILSVCLKWRCGQYLKHFLSTNMDHILQHQLDGKGI